MVNLTRRSSCQTTLANTPCRCFWLERARGGWRVSPEEIYSTKREQIEREIHDEVSQKLAGKHVQLNAVLIREVHLPPAVQTAIHTKLEEEQKALEMQFVLERTKQEAVRKHIEATGIADYQSIISKELNAQVIEWKGIEATEKLAESPNSKVVIVGSGKRRTTGHLEHGKRHFSAGRRPVAV